MLITLLKKLYVFTKQSKAYKNKTKHYSCYKKMRHHIFFHNTSTSKFINAVLFLQNIMVLYI